MIILAVSYRNCQHDCEEKKLGMPYEFMLLFLSRSKKRRTLRCSENAVLIPLVSVVHDQVKTRLSESQSEVEESIETNHKA